MVPSLLCVPTLGSMSCAEKTVTPTAGRSCGPTWPLAAALWAAGAGGTHWPFLATLSPGPSLATLRSGFRHTTLKIFQDQGNANPEIIPQWTTSPSREALGEN